MATIAPVSLHATGGENGERKPGADVAVTRHGGCTHRRDVGGRRGLWFGGV
jgi:hypothetical protein